MMSMINLADKYRKTMSSPSASALEQEVDVEGAAAAPVAGAEGQLEEPLVHDLLQGIEYEQNDEIANEDEEGEDVNEELDVKCGIEEPDIDDLIIDIPCVELEDLNIEDILIEGPEEPDELYVEEPASSGPYSGPNSLPSSGPNSLPSSGPNSLPSSGPNSLLSSGPSSLLSSGPNSLLSSGPNSLPSTGPSSGSNSGPTTEPNSRPTSAAGSGPCCTCCQPYPVVHPIVKAWNDAHTVKSRVDVLEYLATDPNSLLAFVTEQLVPWALNDRNMVRCVPVLNRAMPFFTEEALNSFFLPIFKLKHAALNNERCPYYRVINRLTSFQQNSLICNYLDNVKLKNLDLHPTILLSFIDHCPLPYSTIRLIVEHLAEDPKIFEVRRPFFNVVMHISENLNEQTPPSIIKLLRNLTHHLRPMLRRRLRVSLNRVKELKKKAASNSS